MALRNSISPVFILVPFGELVAENGAEPRWHCMKGAIFAEQRGDYAVSLNNQCAHCLYAEDHDATLFDNLD